MSNRTILIVEDDPDSQAMLSWVLESRGDIGLMAGTAAEAAERVKEVGGRLNGIIVDFHLPDGDGMQLGLSLRQQFVVPTVPLIGVTAYFTLELRAQALAAGFSACFPKPLPMDEFMAALNKLVG